MPYTYLQKGRKFGLKNKRTGKTIWYKPEKVSSMKKLRKMARIREAFAHGFKPTKVRQHTRKGRTVRRHFRK